jgi:hypothetical protein
VTMVVPSMTIDVTIGIIVSCCSLRGMTQVTAVTIDLHPLRGVSSLHRLEPRRDWSAVEGTAAPWDRENRVSGKAHVGRLVRSERTAKPAWRQLAGSTLA